jgi:hypothetical protein
MIEAPEAEITLRLLDLFSRSHSTEHLAGSESVNVQVGVVVSNISLDCHTVTIFGINFWFPGTIQLIGWDFG